MGATAIFCARHKSFARRAGAAVHQAMSTMFDDTPGGRLRLVLQARHRDETPRQWAARYGIPEGTLYGYLNGNRAISVRAAERLQQATGIGVGWILTGEDQAPLAEDESRLINAYRRADATTREIVQRILSPHVPETD